jgi:hypothetical protein
MLRAKGGKASFYDLVTRSQDGILDELGAEVAFNLQRDTSGVRGQVSAINGNVITLTNKRDVEHFKRGMTITGCTGSGGTGIRAGGAKIRRPQPLGREDHRRRRVDDHRPSGERLPRSARAAWARGSRAWSGALRSLP